MQRLLSKEGYKRTAKVIKEVWELGDVLSGDRLGFFTIIPCSYTKTVQLENRKNPKQFTVQTT